MTVYCVGTYLVDLAYGGPEEGGWWYQCGQLIIDGDIPLPYYSTDKEDALSHKNKMIKELEEFNKGRRPISSVLSEGKYEAIIFEERLPEGFPEKIPYYE